MRNKHGGTCYRCGQWVEPGAGHFERHRGGWRVRHVDCAVQTRRAAVREQAVKESLTTGNPSTGES